MKKITDFKTFDELDFIKVGGYYNDGNIYYRIDEVNENGDHYGVSFHTRQNDVSLMVEQCLEWPVSEGIKAITEKEFYTALDLVREDFMRKFKAVRGGVL